MACDYDVIRTVHPDIDRDGVAVLPDDLVTDFLTDAAHEKRAPVTRPPSSPRWAPPGSPRAAPGRPSPAANRGDAITLVRVADPIDLTPATERPAA